MAKQRLEEIRKIRLEKAQELRDLGMEPYPAKLGFGRGSVEKALESEGKEVAIAGRIVGWRGHGNAIFADLKDETGEMQVFFQKKELGEKIEMLKYFDVGDFVAVRGRVFKTEAGEVTVDVSEFQMLTKAIRPLPSSWHGLKDVEERYRKRYLDMLVNSETKQLLDKRWLIEKEIRMFLWKEGFTEVETAVLQELYGGTNARPFTTHMNALDSDFYLRIAPELYLKRMVVGGYEKIFEIARNFRNEGIDATHQPEFTMIEWYEAYANYEKIMNTTEALTRHLVKKLTGGTKLKVKGKDIDVSGEWPRVPMVELVKQYADFDYERASDEEARGVLNENKVELAGEYSKGKALYLIFEHLVAEKLGGPIWVVDYPLEVCPLQKMHPEKEGFAERFEGYMGGVEYCDGWTEITDPVDQRNRFEKEQNRMRAGDEEAHPLDENFIEALEYGMPPLGGIGIGIDRLVMFLTDTWYIRKVIAFPTLRPARGDLRKQKKVESNTEDSISNDLRGKFPGISYAYVLIRDVEIKKEDEKLEKLKEDVLGRVGETTTEEVREMDSVQSYRRMFKETGVDPNSRRPSPEALLRRVVQGKGVYKINTAVDAYNLAVIATGIGLGGFDYDKTKPPFELRLSGEGEEVRLLGDDDVTRTKDGEIVYADSKQLLTLDLNYRDIDETKITQATKNIVLFADGGPGIDIEQVKAALVRGAGYIRQYCGGNVSDVVVVQ